MLRNFHEEVEEARNNLTEAIQATLPSKQLGTTLMLALAYLSFTKERIRRTTNLQERRAYIDEFNKVRSAIEKGIRLLGNGESSFGRGRRDMPELRKRLQDRVAQGR